ncbi:MAG: glycoside hydrolase family 5 protein [Lachnospiraceae bacterium]|nr:glycoside hydrolase family 5 protein [Candidatus Colinaster scatohippi]
MATKYEKHGALHVDAKGKLVDHNNEIVTMHGMSTHGLSWYPEYVNRDFFEFMKKEWHIDVIRLAMYTAEEDGYCVGDEANKKKLLEVIDRGVRFATELGLYVIIDWHILADSNPLMNKDEALLFWNYISKKYASYGNILYEICNEPNVDCCWADIKAYAEEVIPVIRKNDPYAVILVGTPVWSQRVDEAMADPIKIDKNLMYVLHFYANTHKDELRSVFKNAADKRLPLFVTEFGTCSADGAGAHNSEEADKWVSLMDEYDTSYCMWNISNRDETSASFVPTCEKYTNGFIEDDLREPMKWYVGVLDAHKMTQKEKL